MNDRETSISIIVPSLNQGQFISQTIDSILTQQYGNVEVIVVDGGSEDNTIEILRSYGEKILWSSEKDNGQSDAINKGLRLASGDILGYLNSDDYLLPGSLQKINICFQESRADWISGDGIIVDENSVEIQKAIRAYKNFLRSLSIEHLFYITDYLVQPSTFWKREIFEKAGYFDEKLHFSMDYDYWFRLYTLSRPHVLREAISAFRIHPASKGGMNYRKQISEELLLLRKYSDNKVVYFLHKTHSAFVAFVYYFIKDMRFKRIKVKS
ncbi:MAG: glycosyltransferase family 2 protein [Anaerolineaceae bacterium]|nr:glycosyltransferase family 2 protein [Anaerolineaceae bacterium]